MTGKTHAMVGTAAALALLPVNIPKLSFSLTNPGEWAIELKRLVPLAVFLIVVNFASRAADLDQPGSNIAKDIAGPFGYNRLFALLGGLLFVYISKHQQMFHLPVKYQAIPLYIGIVLIFMAILRHRGMTHSIWGALIALYGFNGLQGTYFYQTYIHLNLSGAFIVAYLSHLFVDLCSDHGVFLFYIPFVSVTHQRIRIPTFIRTGSIIDVLVIRLGAFFFVAYTILLKIIIGG